MEEFHRMADAGIFREDDRVELLDGEIIEMTPVGIRHVACVNKLTQLLVERARGRAIVSVQNPLLLSGEGEPQPDLVLLRFSPDFHATRAVEAGDALLVIEVSDTSLAYDAGRKAAAYAAAGVPELWVIDLTAGEVIVRREPVGDAFRVEERRRRGERLEVVLLPGVELAVDEILPD